MYCTRESGWVFVLLGFGVEMAAIHAFYFFSEAVGKNEMRPGAAEESGCVALKQSGIAVRVSHG